jgi:hypothetical protein
MQTGSNISLFKKEKKKITSFFFRLLELDLSVSIALTSLTTNGGFILVSLVLVSSAVLFNFVKRFSHEIGGKG